MWHGRGACECVSVYSFGVWVAALGAAAGEVDGHDARKPQPGVHNVVAGTHEHNLTLLNGSSVLHDGQCVSHNL